MINSEQITEALNIASEGLRNSEMAIELHLAVPADQFSSDLNVYIETVRTLAQTILIHENNKVIENLRAALRNSDSPTSGQLWRVSKCMDQSPDVMNNVLKYINDRFGVKYLNMLNRKQYSEIIDKLGLDPKKVK